MKWIKILFSNLWKLYVGLAFCLTAIVLYPFFYMVLQLKNGKHKSFQLFVLWSRIFQVLCFYRTARKGKVELDLSEPTILIANHTSYLDIFLMFAHFPKHPFLFLGKAELLSYPILRTYFKNLNIPVDRSSKEKSAQAFYAAKHSLEDGFSVIIFPEGGIPNWSPPKMANFKSGPFRLSKLTGCPILPLAFLNHYQLLPDPVEWKMWAGPGVSKIQLFDKVVVEDNLTEVRENCFKQINDALIKHG